MAAVVILECVAAVSELDLAQRMKPIGYFPSQLPVDKMLRILSKVQNSCRIQYLSSRRGGGRKKRPEISTSFFCLGWAFVFSWLYHPVLLENKTEHEVAENRKKAHK